MARSTARRLGIAGAAFGLVGVALSTAPAYAQGHGSDASSRNRHVLLISVDGLHQTDLDWYVRTHPGSAMAALVHTGTDYTNAKTPVPSDSFPGMVAQATGGNPGTTGVYYDDTYNHALLPAGTTNCTPGQATGAEVAYTEQDDLNQNSIDAGQGLSGLPGSILQMTGNPVSVINPASLPVDPVTCKPVYPHNYLQVNTIFEVARQAGLRTAWSDKHPAYEILNGPSGTGVQDLFTPEINSQATGSPAGDDWTKDNAKTQQYDAWKTQAVLNEIDGYDHSRSQKVGVPAIFGLNYQSVSTAQKLPKSDGLVGGYLADGTPGPLLQNALNFVDGQLSQFTAELAKQHLADRTTIILSAKHGQSPTDPAALTRIDDGPMIDALNAAWKKAHPGAADLVAQATDDDAIMMWLSDRSQAAADFAKNFLMSYSGTGNDINGNPRAFTSAGLDKLYAGDEARQYFDAKPGDPRVPDLYGVVKYGVVYTGGHGKIAEHGGANPQDRDVPIVVSGAGAGGHGRTDKAEVETTQIAPTILKLLGLNPRSLDAVRIEGTKVLPGVGRND